jgi:endonuclease/exonuclease/phosphatase family metal-dependent hydrolase
VPITKNYYIDFETRGRLWDKSITGPLSKKGMLCIMIENSNVLFINTHLMQNSERKWKQAGKYPRLLQAQLHQIKDVLSSLPHSTPVLLIGDFNIPKTISLYKKFISDSGLSDAFAAFDFPTYQGDILKDAVPEGRIDYIFYTKSLLRPSKQNHLFTKQVAFANGRKDFLSDHMALSSLFTHVK